MECIEFGLEICSGEITRKNNKARVVFIICNTPTSFDICPYQILSNYLKQYGSYDLHMISASGAIST